MKHIYRKYIGIAFVLSLTILSIPIIITFIPLVDVSNSSTNMVINNNSVLSYYTSVVSGFVGGIFTFIGVQMSLEKQDYQAKQIVRAHKNLILSQLRLSVNALEGVYYSQETYHGKVKTMLSKLIIDSNLDAYLIDIECWGSTDNEVIRKWLGILRRLDEMHDESKDGFIDGQRLKELITQVKLSEIESAIRKLESDIT